ncbi:glutamate racemase [Sulfurovum sp.]|uniref:glutamate racemase n=1 Tax=Sulfurovum sp. TaxID=1969726 RepID=UPI0035623528
MRIGVFDSGLGGLTVVQAMTQVIKGAQIFYVADTKNAPYGEKTPEQILQYSLNITNYLIGTHQIDALILACNTATSSAIQHLRETYPSLIIIGTEPGIKPAIEQTITGRIGVLATPATLQGDKYQKLAQTLSLEKSVEIFEQACPGLVEQIEKGEMGSEETKALLEKWLAPMRENNVDTIVLGCTHYPLVGQSIENIMDCNVSLIHTGEAISKHLLTLGSQKGHLNEGDLQIHIHTTGEIQIQIIDTIIETYENIYSIEIENH